MRITNPMVVRNYTRSLQTNRAMLDRFARQVSTGRRFDTFSQDNSSGVRAMQVRRNLARIETNLDNTRAAQAYLRSAESMMMNVIENSNIINERFILALNDTNGVVDREVVAAELERMQEAILALANGQYAGRFVFGGTNTIQRPFTVQQIVHMVPVGAMPADGVPTVSGSNEFPGGREFIPALDVNGNQRFDAQGRALYEEVNMIPNPAWQPPTITNPDYVGAPATIDNPDWVPATIANPDWVPATIANPLYVGEPAQIPNPDWQPPTIPNPDYPAISADPTITNPLYVGAPATIDNPDWVSATIDNPVYVGAPATIDNPVYVGAPATIDNPDWVSATIDNPAFDPSIPADIGDPTGNIFASVTRGLIYYNGVRVADIDRNTVEGRALYERAFNDGAHLDIGMNVTFSNEADPTQVDPGSAFRFTLVGLNFMGNGTGNSFHTPGNKYDIITEMIEFLRQPFSAQDKTVGDELLNRFQGAMSVANIAITNLGADANFLDFSIDRLLDDQLNLRERQQELEIRPPEEAILDFKMQEFIYNATLQMGQRLLQPTLFDFIR